MLITKFMFYKHLSHYLHTILNITLIILNYHHHYIRHHTHYHQQNYLYFS